MRSTARCGRSAGFPTRSPFRPSMNSLPNWSRRSWLPVVSKRSRVACDEGYGDSPAFLQRLDATGLWYLAEVPRDTKVWPLLETDGQTERSRPSSWVPPQTPSRKGPAPQRERLHPASPAKVPLEELAKQWPKAAWRRFRLLEGHKGPLVADFLVLRAVLPLDRLPGPEVWVVIRRKVSGAAEEPEWKFYLSNAPLETPLATCVRVSGMRWPIETCFAEGKGELGMDHYELRFWRGWHHHMTLVILAHHLPFSLATTPQPERGGSCARRPRVPSPHQMRYPAWTHTLPFRLALPRCACSCAFPCPSLCLICLRHWP
jgi:SRSO17 transposase